MRHIYTGLTAIAGLAIAAAAGFATAGLATRSNGELRAAEAPAPRPTIVLVDSDSDRAPRPQGATFHTCSSPERATASAPASASMSTIEGRVVDIEGNPVAGAQVFARPLFAVGTIDPRTEGVLTDEHGRFHIPDLAAGQYRIFAIHTNQLSGATPPIEILGRNSRLSGLEVVVDLEVSKV